MFNGPMATESQFSDVRGKLDDVKDVMVKNIEMVLERGEKLELLVDKTDRLNATAFTFERSSRRLKEQMFWKKVKLVSPHSYPWRASSFSCSCGSRAARTSASAGRRSARSSDGALRDDAGRAPGMACINTLQEPGKTRL